MQYNFRIHIHLGAHKTASTFIQNWLARNLPFLKNNNIAYVPLESLRRSFSPAFWELAEAANPSQITPDGLREILFAEAEACGFDLNTTKLFVLSEENILGSLSSLSINGILYPRLADRLQVLAKIFEGYEIQVFFSVRSYVEFYPSAYAETLRDGFIKTLEKFLEDLALSDNSWLQIIDIIESVFGPAKIWRYENFISHAHLVLSELLQRPIAANWLELNHVVRRSLSQKGLSVAMACRDTLSDLEIKRLVNLFTARMVFEQPDKKISIQDSQIVNVLNEKYHNELEALSGRMIDLEAGVAGYAS